MEREPGERYQDLETMRQDLAVVRARLFETAADLESAADPNAETRFDSPRVSSGVQPRPSSRAGSALLSNAAAVGSRPSVQITPPRRRITPLVIAAMAGVTLTTALFSGWMLNRPPDAGPPASTGAAAPPQAQPPAPSPSRAEPPENVKPTARDPRVSSARVTARQQIDARQYQPALDTLVTGLAIDAKDPELGQLVVELETVARRTATRARAAALARGAGQKSSAAFREGQARERQADRLLETGDRVAAIHAAWGAAALYDLAPEGTSRNPSTAPGPGAPARPATNPRRCRSRLLLPLSRSRRYRGGPWRSRRV
jgi:hypothetical protein